MELGWVYPHPWVQPWPLYKCPSKATARLGGKPLVDDDGLALRLREETTPPSRQPTSPSPSNRVPTEPAFLSYFGDHVSMPPFTPWVQGKFYSCNDLSKMTEEECRYINQTLPAEGCGRLIQGAQ